MKRSHLLLAGVAIVLVLAAFWFLLWQPQRDELADIEASIVEEQTQQARLTGSIDTLREVRRNSPELESQLAAYESIIPEGNELPSVLRQLQLAADDSGVILQTVSTGRPTTVPDAAEGLSSISLSVQVVGEYFQIVDFLRRVEDPAITPRGVEWSATTLSPTDYPELNVSLTGSVYAVITQPAPPQTEDADQPEETDDADPDADTDADPDADPDTDTDVDVDVDVEDDTTAPDEEDA